LLTADGVGNAIRQPCARICQQLCQHIAFMVGQSSGKL